MGRLIDALIFDGALFAGESPRDQKHWAFNPDDVMPEIFDISNVTDYFADTQTAKKQPWQLEDFPNVAPPFQFFWMEFKRPESTFSKMPCTHVAIRRAGCLVESVTEAQAREVLESEHVTHRIEDFDPLAAPITNLEYNKARWVLDFTIFVEHSELKHVIECERQFLLVNEEGVVVDHATHARLGHSWGMKSVDEVKDFLGQARYAVMYPALLAISFLHCRNVTQLENAAPAKLQKARLRRNKPALLTYKTLRIEPMTKVLRASGAQSEETGLKQSLHIARGHFKHYGEKYINKKTGQPCKKLFNKIEGSFFTPALVKGHSKHGVVVKDYSVDAQKP